MLPSLERFGADLSLQAFPTLVSSPSNPENITAGTTIILETRGYEVQPAPGSTQVYAAFITVTGPVFAE